MMFAEWAWGAESFARYVTIYVLVISYVMGIKLPQCRGTPPVTYATLEGVRILQSSDCYPFGLKHTIWWFNILSRGLRGHKGRCFIQ